MEFKLLSDPIYSHKQCMQFFNRSEEGNGQFLPTPDNTKGHLEADLHYHWTQNVTKKDAALASAVCASNNRPQEGRKDYKAIYDQYRDIREKAFDKYEILQDDKTEGVKLNPNPPEVLSLDRRFIVKDRIRRVGTDESV